MTIKLSDIELRGQDALKEKRAINSRNDLWKHLLIGLIMSIVITAISYHFVPRELARVGGSLVGLSVFLQMYIHWLELNPTKDNVHIKASKYTVISGVIALLGTVLWTFGDKI